MKPATSLPWEVGGDDSDCVIRERQRNGFTPDSVAEVHRDRDDAAYIVHACNAYPRLVAALQATIDADTQMGFDKYIAKHGFGQSYAVPAARTLLAELGEDK